MENKENANVADMFSKMGEKLGWFDYGDVNTAIKCLSKSAKKKSNRSRLKKKSDSTDENTNGTKNDLKKSLRSKKILKDSNTINAVEDRTVSKPSLDHIALQRTLNLSSSSDLTEKNLCPQKNIEDMYDISICDFSRVDDIGLPIVESTRIHRNSVYYSCLNSSSSSSDRSKTSDETPANYSGTDSFEQLNVNKKQQNRVKKIKKFVNVEEGDKISLDAISKKIDCLEIAGEEHCTSINTVKGSISENIDSEDMSSQTSDILAHHDDELTTGNTSGCNGETRFISFYSSSDVTSNDSELSVLVQDQSIQVDISCSLDELYQTTSEKSICKPHKLSKSSSSSSEGSYVEVIDVSVQINIDDGDENDMSNATRLSPEVSLTSNQPFNSSCLSTSSNQEKTSPISYQMNNEDGSFSGTSVPKNQADSCAKSIADSGNAASANLRCEEPKTIYLDDILGSDDDYLYSGKTAAHDSFSNRGKYVNNVRKKKTSSSDDSWSSNKKIEKSRKVFQAVVDSESDESSSVFGGETVGTKPKKLKSLSLKKNRTKSKKNNLDKIQPYNVGDDLDTSSSCDTGRGKISRKHIVSVSSKDFGIDDERLQRKQNPKFDSDSEDDENFYSFINETQHTSEKRTSETAIQMRKKSGRKNPLCSTDTDKQTGSWRSKTYSSSSSDDDDKFETYLQKVKSQSKQPVESSSDGLENFIVDDDDVSSGSDDSIFYITTTQALNTGSASSQSPICLDSSKDDSLSVSDNRSSDADSDKLGNVEENSDEKIGRNISKQPPPFKTPSVPKPRTSSNSLRKPKQSANIQSSLSTGTVTETFLKSLSTNIPVEGMHSDAIKFAKNFKKNKEELTNKLFYLYNKTVFDSQIPETTPIIWNKRMLKTAGYCVYKKDPSAKFGRTVRIELSTKVCDTTERVRDTLIHEMCHAAVWLLTGNNEGHGPYWKYWARKSNITHPELPIINRCHSYKISCRYIYKCTKCGYSLGRHSKSLDISKKVCGYCHGHFELVDSKKSTSDQIADGTSTPRTPNKFAMFVKDNYASIKKSNKGAKHAELMSMLSQKFSEQKIS